MTKLPDFPVDDITLDLILDSMKGCYTVDEEGNHTLIGAEFSFHQLLNFLSGYDESKLIREDDIGDAECYTYPDPIYDHNDVIKALIEEIKKLRND